MSKLTLGADPEIIVIKDGKVSHCIGQLGGTKEEPLKVAGGALQEDNVLFEFNIDPCDKYEDFTSRIDQVIAQGMDVLGDRFSLSDKSSHIFTPSELSMMPEQAMVFGCEPDFNALTGMMNPKPTAANAGLRTAGGHIHFGIKEMLEAKGEVMDENKVREIIVLSDYYLGLTSLMLDTDDRRRELYGKAGAMRFKEYGGEYRTLSNFWIHKEANRKWAWDQANKVVDMLPNLRDLITIVPPNRVQEAINTSNRKLASEFINVLKLA